MMHFTRAKKKVEFMKSFIALFFSFVLGQNALAAFAPIEGVDVFKDQKISFSPTAEKKHIVVVFLSANCPCSASHEELLTNLSTDFPSFQFIAVHSNADEDMKTTQEHFKSGTVKFPLIQDIKSTLANRFGALKTPHAYVLDSDGKLLYQGGVTDSHVGPTAKKQYLKEILTDISQGKAPRVKETRSLGCYIQRGDDA
ncbi:Redoxin [compost metagenome]